MSDAKLIERLRDHRRYLIGLAEAPVMFNADGSDVKRCRRMADDIGSVLDLLDPPPPEPGRGKSR